MQNIQWIQDNIFIIIILIALGYLIAWVLYSRKLTRINILQKEAELLNNQNKNNQSEIQQLSQNLHEKEVNESKLNTQLAYFKTNEQRLSSELTDAKLDLTQLNEIIIKKNQDNHNIETQKEIYFTENQVQKKQLAEIKQKLTDEQEKYDILQHRFQSLSNQYTELKTNLDRKEENFKEQFQQLRENKQVMTTEFENLANKIFEEKGKTFTQTSQTNIDALLKPFRDQIEGFQKRINEVHDASLQGNASLNAEIKKVLDVGLHISQEANNLTHALKGNSQQRGAWGEAQLRRTLEFSGLVENTHFEVQSSFKDNEGKQKQTDYLIKLPDNKHIIIDSKVTLNAYDRMVMATNTPEEYKLAINEHIKAVRKHIDDLASKDYTNLIGVYSPSFVLMFMPIEPAYIEALKNSKDLFDYGYNKGIILVSHTTLIPILRTISNLWMIEHSNIEAREISEKAGEIYNQVYIIAEHLNKLGGTLNTASNHYNNTVRALAGKQGLYGKVDRFNQLSTKARKNLPIIEPSNIDFETERLNLIIEPVKENDALDS